MDIFGTLTIKPICLNTTRDTDAGKMDPYLKLKLGEEELKTKVYSGQQIDFDDEPFRVAIPPMASFTCVVMDDDFFCDDYVAQTVVPLQDAISYGHTKETCILTYEGENVGEVVFQLMFERN